MFLNEKNKSLISLWSEVRMAEVLGIEKVWKMFGWKENGKGDGKRIKQVMKIGLKL